MKIMLPGLKHTAQTTLVNFVSLGGDGYNNLLSLNLKL
jgi:hypothetical protein